MFRFSLRTLLIVFAVVGLTIAMLIYPAMRISRRAQAITQLKANGIHLFAPEETRHHYHFVLSPGLLDAATPPEVFFGWQKSLFGSEGGEPRMACVFELPELRNAAAAGTLSNVGEALRHFPELRMFDSSYGADVPVNVDEELRRILDQVAALPELRFAASEFLDDNWISALPENSKLIEFWNSQGTMLPTPTAVRMLLQKAPALERLSLNFRSLDANVTADIQQRAETAPKTSPVRLFVRFKHGDSPPTAEQIEFLKTFTMEHEITFIGSSQQPSSWEVSGLAAQKISLSGGNSITIRDCPHLVEANIEADILVVTACPRLQKFRGSCSANATVASIQISNLPELHSLELVNDHNTTIDGCPKLLDLELNRYKTTGSQMPPGKTVLKRSAAPRTLTIVEHELEVEDPTAIHELRLNAKSQAWYEPLRAFPQVRWVNIHSVPYLADNKAWNEALRLGANIERMQLSLLDHKSGQPGQTIPDLRQANRLKILQIPFNSGVEPSFASPGDDGKPVTLLPKNLELLLLGNPYFRGAYDSKSQQIKEHFAIIKRDHPQLLVVERSSLPLELRIRIDKAGVSLSELPDIEELRPYNAEWWKSLAPAP